MAGSVKDLIIRMLVDDKELSKFDTDKPAKFGDALNKASGVSVAALGGIAAAAVTVTNQAAGVEVASDKLAASLGLTADEAERAEQAAKGAFGGGFASSFEQAAAATESVISSIEGMRNASVEQIEGITTKVLTLSDGFELEAGKITQVVGQMLSTGLASSAEQGIDLLTAALKKVPAAVRADVLDAVDEYGPFFAGIGMDGEAAMSALVKASEKGMYGIDKTGDAVKEFSIRSTDMSSASIAAYEAAGLSAEEMAGKIIAGGEKGREGFQQVIDGLLGIQDPVERANAAIGLFGTPLEDLGVNEIPAFLASLGQMSGGLGEVSGTADRMMGEMGDNLQSKLDSMANSWTLAGAEIGEAFLPAVSNITDQLKGFADWAADNKDGVVILGSVVAGLAGSILAVSAAMQVYAAAQALQTIAQWSNNAAWWASPTTWIIAGIIVGIGLLIAAGVLLYQNWDQVCAWFESSWRELGNFWDDTVTNWQNGFDAIGQGWNDMVSGWSDTAENIGTSLYNTFAGWVNAIAGLWNSTLGSLSFTMPSILGGGRIAFPRMANIPMLAEGGIVNSATLAIIGEAGPEAVVPLDQLDSFGGRGGPQIIELHHETRLDSSVLARSVKRVQVREGW